MYLNEKISKNKSNKILKLIFLVCLIVVFSIILFLGKYFNAYAAGGAFATDTKGKMTLQYTDANGKYYEWEIKIDFGDGLRNHNLNDAGSSYSSDKISVTSKQTKGDKKNIKCEWLWLGYDMGDESISGGYYRNITIQFLIPRTTGADTFEAVGTGYSQSNYAHSFVDESTEQDIKDGYYRTGATFPLQDMGIGIVGDGYEVPPAHQVTTNAVIHMKSVYNKYTVNFDGNGADGGSTTENKCTYQTAFDLNANGFYKNNYIFTSWNTKADGTGTSYTDKQNVNNLTATKDGTVTLYAQWFKNKYTLSFNADGGTLPTNGNLGLHGNLSTDRKTGNVTVTYNDPSFSIMDNDCPSREGYTFDGWYKAYWNDNGTLNHLEQIYNSSGRAVESSIWGYWDNNWHYKYAGDETLWASYTKNNYPLDLNIVYGGKKLCSTEEILPYIDGFDVYIDGNLVAENVPDYWAEIPYGSTYEFKNFRMKPGYVFTNDGSLSGTVGAKENEAVAYVYDNHALAYYDGNGATGGQYEAGNGSDYYVGYNVREAYEKYNANASVINNKFTKSNYSFVNYKTENGNYRKAGEDIDPSDNSNAKAVIKSAYNNDLVFNIAGNIYKDGTNICLWWNDCYNESNYWSFLPSGDGYFFIVNNYSGMFLDLVDGNAYDLANVQLCHLNWSYAQQWKITAAGNGYYYIASRCNENYRLDAQGSIENSKPGQNVCVYHAIDYDGQRWKIDFLNREDYFQVQWTPATRLTEYYGNGDNDNFSYFKSLMATDDNIADTNRFKRIGYTFTGYNTSADNSGKSYKENDVIDKTDCQGITLIRNHTNYNMAVKQNNSTLYAQPADYEMAQWWSFIKADNAQAYYIMNMSTGQALYSSSGEVKAAALDKNNSAFMWDLELVDVHEYQISVHNKNEYLTMRSDNSIYVDSKYSDTESSYDYQVWNIEGISSDLYAQWKPIKYNIVFDSNKPSSATNSVTGNMPNIACKYDVPVKIPANSYQINGWDFVGFNTEADGSGDNIIPGSTVINLTSVNNGVVVLYAQWDAHMEWNASLSKINNDSINALNLTNVDRAVNWEHGLGFGKVMYNTLTFTEFGDMKGFFNVEINNVVPKKIKYEFSDTRINSIQLSNDEHTDIGIENGKAVYLHNVSSATSSGYLHKISFNIPDYEAEFDVNKEKEYSAYVDISVSYNVRNTGNEITETRRVYYNLEELDMSKVHSRIRRQPGQANN